MRFRHVLTMVLDGVRFLEFWASLPKWAFHPQHSGPLAQQIPMALLPKPDGGIGSFGRPGLEMLNLQSIVVCLLGTLG